MPHRNIAERAIFIFGIAASIACSLGSLASAAAQTRAITSLTVVKKPGKTDGEAIATVQGKKGRIAKHAVQAWIIMDGHGALLLLSPQKSGQPHRLRYYQLDVEKGRTLGNVPFSEATVAESKTPQAPWTFAIAGIDSSTRQPVILAGNTDAIHAQLAGSAPHFANGSLTFQSPAGEKTLAISALLGQEAAGRIYAPATPSPQVAYLQFLPNGESLLANAAAQMDRGHWITDGTNFRVTSEKGQISVWHLADLHPITGVPAASRLDVRLLQPLSSRTATKGMEVKAVLISPGVFEGAILLPQGSEFTGHIVDAHGVGHAIKHETAALTLHFESVKLPDGRTLPVDARIYKVENSRESVTKDGKIQGIRSTGTIGYTAENKVSSLVQVDPIAYLFTSSAGPAVLGFADPEILYNAGTELNIEFNAPLITSQKYESNLPHMTLSSQESEEFHAMVKDLPFVTRTESSHKPSDITNLIFIGQPEALRRAFMAAGWTTSDELTAAATFKTMKTLTGNQTYTEAPMSVLILGDEKPIFNLQKTTNTFSSRHHLRVFRTGETFEGQPVLTASSTQDIGIAFSYKQKTFIHVIDQYLDNERSKIINDLHFTGCVESLDMVPRPWVPRDAYNSTGDRLITDGDAAVLRMSACTDPHTTPATPAERANLASRSERNTMLAIKDTLYRGNLVYSGISGGIKAHNYFSTQGELEENTGNWRKSDASGTEYRLAGTAPSLQRRSEPWDKKQSDDSELDAASKARIAEHRWDPPSYELAVHGGYSNYRNKGLEFTVVEMESSDPSKPAYLIGMGDAVDDGWAAGVSLTLNTWNWVSNEFAYFRQQTKFDLLTLTVSSDPNEGIFLDVQTVGLVSRQFEYNTVLNLRPRKSRWRPYIAAGPVLQLLALSDAPLKKPSGYFRLGLSNIGLVKAAFDFGSTPPLDGGGIFQLGLQYGGGIKYRVHPRITLRGDFRETWAPNPQIIRDSYEGLEPEGLDDTYTTVVTSLRPDGKFFLQRATVGIAFTF